VKSAFVVSYGQMADERPASTHHQIQAVDHSAARRRDPGRFDMSQGKESAECRHNLELDQ